MPAKTFLSKLDNLLFTPKFGGNIISDYRLHTSPRYTNKTTQLLGKRIQISDAPSFLSTRKEIFANQVYRFNSTSTKPIILDCGANIGLSSIYFATNYPNGIIHSYEPDDAIFKLLKYNIAQYNITNVEVHNSAIWVENGTISFDSQGGLSGKITSEVKNDSVKTVRLKDELEKYKKVDFLKIDIEGAEHQVLKDIADDLDKVENIFIEYHSSIHQPQELDLLLSIITKAGFRYHIKEAYTSNTPFLKITTQHNMDLQLDISASRNFNIE